MAIGLLEESAFELGVMKICRATNNEPVCQKVVAGSPLPHLSPYHAQRIWIGRLFARAAVTILNDRVALSRGKKKVRLQAVLLGIEIVVASAPVVEFFVRAAVDNASFL